MRNETDRGKPIKKTKPTRTLINHSIIGSFVAILCVTLLPASAQDKAPESSYRVLGMVRGRLELPDQMRPLKLGEENDISVQFHGFTVHSVIARFSYLDSTGNPLTDDPETEATIKYHSDGSAHIQVVPRKVGKATLHLEVRFSDGGMEGVFSDVDVTVPDEKPEKFLVARGADDSETHGTLDLDLAATSNHINFGPMAVYSEHEGPVPIPVENVHFKIISANAANPPISVDPSSGRITTLHIGHALVQTTFEDCSDLICVDVMEDASDGGDRTNCAELVPSGMAAPLWGNEGEKLPKKIKISPEP